MRKILAVVVLGLSLAGCVYAPPGPGYYSAPGYHYYYYP